MEQGLAKLALDDKKSEGGVVDHGKPEAPSPIFVATLDELRSAARALRGLTPLALDAEGIDLQRDGKCCVVQVAARDGALCYVIDSVALCERGAWRDSGMADVLEAPSTEKLMWDGRMDCDALLHQFGVRVANVFDLQVAEVFLRRARGEQTKFVHGLGKAMASIPVDRADAATQRRFEQAKIRGKSLFGGSRGYGVWLERPLPADLLEYAVHDVVHLFFVQRYYARAMTERRTAAVRRESVRRIDLWRDAVRKRACDRSCALTSDISLRE